MTTAPSATAPRVHSCARRPAVTPAPRGDTPAPLDALPGKSARKESAVHLRRRLLSGSPHARPKPSNRRTHEP